MRHRVSGRKLSRDKDHRKALFRNLVTSLVLHEQIQTTEAKAKAVRGLVDKVITKGKTGSLHARRVLVGFLTNQKAVEKVVKILAPRFRQRSGGFTRIIRLGKRQGDNAPLVRMELVDKVVEKKPAKSARGGPGGKKKEKKEKVKKGKEAESLPAPKLPVPKRVAKEKQPPLSRPGLRPMISSLIKRPPKKTE